MVCAALTLLRRRSFIMAPQLRGFVVGSVKRNMVISFVSRPSKAFARPRRVAAPEAYRHLSCCSAPTVCFARQVPIAAPTLCATQSPRRARSCLLAVDPASPLRIQVLGTIGAAAWYAKVFKPAKDEMQAFRKFHEAKAQ